MIVERAELAWLYFLHRIPGVGNRTLEKLKRTWGTIEACRQADCSQLTRVLPPDIASMLAGRDEDRNLRDLEDLDRKHIKICCADDPDYPVSLAGIFDPPFMFYYRGDLSISSHFCLGVVGSRAATAYGKIQTEKLSRAIALQGWVVVSGMARGIDTEAHKGALAAAGKTIAVLGSGLEVVYPPENRQLFETICAQGLVISEFPPLTHPEPGHFPRRNRILAGLCQGVVVVEAKEKSGALITADFALENGRDVFAVPGPINSPNSKGPHNLIRQGACLVGGFEDILTEYGIEPPVLSPSSAPGGLEFKLDHQEQALLAVLGASPLHWDLLQTRTGWNAGQLSAVLLKMELQGIIKALPGNCFIRT
jgi:DNA processing protein